MADGKLASLINKEAVEADVEAIAATKAAGWLFRFLMDKTTGKIRDEAKYLVFGNEEVIDGLFKRAIAFAIKTNKFTEAERQKHLHVVVQTISRERQNDYRRILVASCFGLEELKDEKRVDAKELLPVLAGIIADEVKLASDPHALDENSQWREHLTFYDLDQSLEMALGLEEHEHKLDERIKKNQESWERRKQRFPYSLFFR